VKLTCPSCAARFPVEAALDDEEARRALARAFELPAPLARAVMRYLALFAPAQRALAWRRVVRLLEELLAPIRAGALERHGRSWPAPLEYWEQAIEAVLAARDAGRLRLPLRSHGYLYECVVARANAAEGEREARTEAARRAGRPAAGEPARPALRTQPSAVQQLLDQRLAELSRDGEEPNA